MFGVATGDKGKHGSHEIHFGGPRRCFSISTSAHRQSLLVKQRANCILHFQKVVKSVLDAQILESAGVDESAGIRAVAPTYVQTHLLLATVEELLRMASEFRDLPDRAN